LDNVYKSNIKITKLKRIQLSSQEAVDVLQSQRHKPNYMSLVNGISNGPIVVVELLGSDALTKWKNIVGLGDIVCDIEQDALNRINEGAFKAKLGINTATYNECTCCVIKPHIVTAGMLGGVIYEIQKAGFDISAVQAVCIFK
jgi:nucleoside-diphosphate kinase